MMKGKRINFVSHTTQVKMIDLGDKPLRVTKRTQ